jgi:major membrane immunogen (membrane-anchored lipoprotein)
MKAMMVAALAACSLLVACGDKPQTSGQRKADAAPYTGAQAAYTAGGWKAGDAVAWEAQLKTRSQGQNEYSRETAP